MFFILLLALCLTFETAAPKTFEVVFKDGSNMTSRKLKEKCHRLRGRIVRIENVETQQKVEHHISRLNGLKSFLVDGARGIGLNWTKFYYADGTQINYTNWITGHSNSVYRRCIEVLATGQNVGKWNDVRCWWPQAALCEIPKTFEIVQKDDSNMTSRHLKDKCRRLNGRLARIESTQDQRAAEVVLRGRQALESVLVDGARGIGSHRTRFYYADGTRINYTNWKSGAPDDENESCIEVFTIVQNFGQWNDVRCSWVEAALCEIPTFEFVYTDESDTSTRHFQDKCRHLNGRLARIENAEDQRAAVAILGEMYLDSPVLVDGQRGNTSSWRRFFYEDGTSISYSNWKSGEPRSWKDTCIELLTDLENYGQWNDVRCWWPVSALCEI